MENKLLTNFGLTRVQAEIYAFLLESGEFKASEIAKKIKRPRGVAYKGLDELLKMGFVEKIENRKIAFFRAEHPNKLEKLFIEKESEFRRRLIEKEEDLKKEKEVFNKNLPDFISLYNLAHNKPGVKYYEGMRGVTGVLEHIADSFKPDTEIVSFVKVLPVEFEREVNDSFAYFVRKRIEKNVKTRVLAVDTPEGRELQKKDAGSLRETRLTRIKNLPLDFPGGEIFIYENEICAVMMEKSVYFAFTVQSRSIAQMLKVFFESEWELLSFGEMTSSNSSRNSSEDGSFSKTA